MLRPSPEREMTSCNCQAPSVLSISLPSSATPGVTEFTVALVAVSVSSDLTEIIQSTLWQSLYFWTQQRSYKTTVTSSTYRHLCVRI